MKRIDNREITIEFVENKLGIKLTYPLQFVEGNIDNEKYAELTNFGCSDILDSVGHWLHRDCFSGQRNDVCEKCSYYPIVKKFREENGVSSNNEPDFNKVFEIMKHKELLDQEIKESRWKKILKNLKKS